ncbi:MAG: hypothetical protein DMD91_20015 [Candidatus Rokuibacteriota bacterium]|nr:MAG: hypothetical protein DMD91_20015 [Candidatus Rokubacteria bacterium]
MSLEARISARLVGTEPESRTRPLGGAWFTGRALSDGRWLALIAVVFYLVVFFATLGFPLATPVAALDEQLNYYQIARNFVTYGVLNSGFLQDLSTSSNPAHHPYVYNHMPPGPELLIAAFSAVAGERFVVVRLALMLGFVGGVACFFAFARLVLQRGGVAGAGYAVVFVTGASALFTMSHPAHALSLLFTFFPVVALDRYYSGGRRVWLGLAIAVAFVGSIYAVTPVFLSILLSWALFSMLGLVRIDRRHFVALVAAGAAGIVLHLVQVMVFLGPAVFAQELRITLSNRAFGVPSAEEVMSFYRSHGIVLNGIHELSASRLARALNQALRFPGRSFVVGLGLLFVASRLLVPSRGSSDRTAITWLVRLTTAILATISLGFVMFPAYGADYGLAGLNEFLLALGAVAVVGLVIREVVTTWQSGATDVRRGAAAVVLVVALVVTAAGVGRIQTQNVQSFVTMARQPSPWAPLTELSERLPGRIVMTNAYPITAGFFTREAAFGGCGPRAFTADGRPNPTGCHAAFIRGFDGQGVRPTHFILFRDTLYISFSRCLGECLDRLYDELTRRHERLFETRLFSVFALKEG